MKIVITIESLPRRQRALLKMIIITLLLIVSKIKSDRRKIEGKFDENERANVKPGMNHGNTVTATGSNRVLALLRSRIPSFFFLLF